MASEKRLIDANALQRKICGAKCGCEYEDCGCEGDCQFDFFLSNAPAVDAVEVVRCKDCKHFDEHTRKCYVFCDHEYEVQLEVDSDHFCSYGERRTDG